LSERAGPCAGLKVLDLTWAAAGPVVTTYLTFLGADVVKVEHSARPDLMRVSDKQYGYGNDRGINDSPLFNELAADKRSIELDLNDPEDLALATELALKADILVENMRPGKIEKFGLSYERLSKLNPGLIMCSVSATGRSSVEGPPGYAPIFWAEGGGAWMTGWPDRNPGLVRGPIDLHTAAFACVGVLSLLRQRTLTGRGGYLDCSAIEAVASTVGVHLMEAQCLGGEPVRSGNEQADLLINDVFPTSGVDQWVALSVHDEREAAVLVAILNEEFGSEIGLADILGEDAWTRLAAVTSSLDGARLQARLLDAGVACAVSTSMLKAMSDEGLVARGALQPIEHDTIGTQVIIGLPWQVNGVAYPISRPAPKLGADKSKVVSEWLGREAEYASGEPALVQKEARE
jgi:crotonobetainyl-CoA:carnitine CoA-transferase CaiB-like acyl-CoA transferase